MKILNNERIKKKNEYPHEILRARKVMKKRQNQNLRKISLDYSISISPHAMVATIIKH